MRCGAAQLLLPRRARLDQEVLGRCCARAQLIRKGLHRQTLLDTLETFRYKLLERRSAMTTRADSEADGAGAPLPELYVRVTVADASDDTAAATAAVAAAAEMEWEGEILRLALEEGGVRPPTLLVAVWDKDFMTGEPPLASPAGQLES